LDDEKVNKEQRELIKVGSLAVIAWRMGKVVAYLYDIAINWNRNRI
jgi:hypothetical protein